VNPQSTIMAASWRHFFEALDEKSLMICSVVSWSARIRSAARGYPIDRAASEAPAAKYRASVSVETRRIGGVAVNIKNPLGEKREIDSTDKREALQSGFPRKEEYPGHSLIVGKLSQLGD
jgi:hypothetical protein